jgi:hypothetical protein
VTTNDSAERLTSAVHTAVKRTPVIVRHNGLRPVSADELLHAIGGTAALEGMPVGIVIDTAQFAEDIDNGNWGASHGEVWRRALEARDLLREATSARLIYAGMPEVPHAVAFGAYLEEHWPIEAYDYHNGTWAWPSTERTLNLSDPAGLPLDRMSTAGPAVLRVEISYRVTDDQVRQFVVEEEQVADIRIAPKTSDPRPGLVRSRADLDEVRRAVAQAVATLIDRRPKTTTIHLFIAAPVSACVVTGQELRLRNHPPVQTYRYRRNPDGTNRTSEAIRLSSGGPTVIDAPLTAEQTALAVTIRAEVWTAAVEDLERYAERKQLDAKERRAGEALERWYDSLPWDVELRRVQPFPALPPVYRMVKRPASVDPVSFDGEGFGFQREERLWRINDGFSLRLNDRFPDQSTARALVRIFLIHEYLHEVHGITKASYREVGKFPNGLERADYMCDLYGMLHELDMEASQDGTLRSDFEQFKRRIAELIDLVVRSFWAFEPTAPLEWMEIRRIRRYMNWYWQQIRVRMAETPFQVAAVLARQPVVEIAGVATRAEGRRYFGSLRRLDPGVGLELGIVLDSEQLHRINTGVNTPLEELVRAFRERDHVAIQEIFRGVYAEAESTGHALPQEEDLP